MRGDFEIASFGSTFDDVLGADVCVVLGSVKDRWTTPSLVEVADEFVVLVKDGNPGGGKGVDQLFLSVRYTCDGIEKLQVNRSHDCHYTDVRPGNLRQLCDFACVIHSHLTDVNVCLGLNAQQLQRQPDVVVEVSLGLQDLVLRRQHLGDRFLGSGLACG